MHTTCGRVEQFLALSDFSLGSDRSRKRRAPSPLFLGVAVLLLATGTFAAVAPAAAQSAARGQEIGKTSVGNPVYLEPRSVKKGADGIITATVRVTFVKPVKTPNGPPITSSRTVAMFDCAKRVTAVKENIYFHDERANRVYQRSAPAKPGYSSPIRGTLPDVALAHLCGKGG